MDEASLGQRGQAVGNGAEPSGSLQPPHADSLVHRSGHMHGAHQGWGVRLLADGEGCW